MSSNKNIQHFTSSGTATHNFGRSISSIVVTFESTNTMSFDGTNFINVVAGTYQFNQLGFLKAIHFAGAGTRSGFGIAV